MEDDIVEPTDPVDPVVPDPIPRDITVMGQKRKPTSAHQTLQDAEVLGLCYILCMEFDPDLFLAVFQ